MFYAARRHRLQQQLTADEILLLFASSNFALPQEKPDILSDFYYLTGINDPEAIALITATDFILFLPCENLKYSRWKPLKITFQEAKTRYHADKVLPIDNFALNFTDATQLKIYSNLPQPIINLYFPCLANHTFFDSTILTSNLRVFKEAYELECIKEAAAISCSAHLRLMKALHYAKYEYELAAELLYEFTRVANATPAFSSIVASGKNSCILHYDKNDAILPKNSVIVVDAACSFKHYAADISRTLPTGGKFTPAARAVYEIVLETQLEVIQAIKPGITFTTLQSIAEQKLAAGLMKLGIIKNPTREQYCPFTIHKIGHFLGLNVHDAGDYTIPLQPGMVIAIEPGLYLPETLLPNNSPYKNIGIRIEDDILITESGCTNLTAKLPKTVAALESLTYSV